MNCKDCGKQEAFLKFFGINCHAGCPIYAEQLAKKKRLKEARARASIPYNIVAESRKRAMKQRRYNHV